MVLKGWCIIIKSKNKKELSTEDALVETFKIMLDYSIAEDKLYMEHLNTRTKFLNHQIQFLRDSEPLKLFKSSHKKWNDELEELENQLMETYEKIGEEITEQHNFYEKLKNKKPSK